MQRNRRRMDERELQHLVDDFNRDYPVGTPVMLRKDSGEVETRVTAPAQIWCETAAIAYFAGHGMYSIDGNDGRGDRIRPVPAEALAP